MTSANAPSRLYIPVPFANSTNDHATVGATSSENLNFVDGFPSAYSASNPNGGKFITRKEINFLGYLASVNEYARACGGIVTFDATLCTQIGGYPRGAVLELLEGLDYNRVISLVESNTWNFLTDGVDGVHWAYLGNGSIAYMETLCKIGSIGATPRQSHIPIGGFRAPRSGIPYFDGSFSFVEAEFPEGQEVTGEPMLQIYLFEGTSDPSSLDGVSIAGDLPTLVTRTCIYDTFSNTGSAVLKNITSGLYYSVWAAMAYGGIESHDFALKLS